MGLVVAMLSVTGVYVWWKEARGAAENGEAPAKPRGAPHSRHPMMPSASRLAIGILTMSAVDRKNPAKTAIDATPPDPENANHS